MNKIFYPIIIAPIFLLLGCNNNQGSHGHSHDVVGGQESQGASGQAPEPLSFTIFSDNYELFVEFPPLVVGKTSAFAAHFTQLNDYKPVSSGRVIVSMVKGGKGIKHTVESPTSPGIFRPALQPKEAGNYRLEFTLETENGTTKYDAGQISVAAEAENILNTEDPGNGDDIVFLKEQAWKTEFETQEVLKQPFYTVINTSAKVKSQPQAEISLNAQSAGKVLLKAVLGEAVSKGDLLAVIAGAGLENNISVKLDEYRFAFEKSKADYIRTKPLVDKQAVSQKNFLEIRSRYMQDSLKYFQIAKNITKNGLKILAPFNGYVSDIGVANGEYIENGSKVLTVSNNNQILIEAYVNQSDFQLVKSIFDAHFKLPSKDYIIHLSDISGKVKAATAFVNDASSRIPVTFTASNKGMLIPGMFLEAYLLAEKKENALVIPLSAVIEEQGQYYVFVQTGGESFVKRQIVLANNDGEYTDISSGLQQGDRIVTLGAYQIKLAAMAGDLPLHGHTH